MNKQDVYNGLSYVANRSYHLAQRGFYLGLAGLTALALEGTVHAAERKDISELMARAKTGIHEVAREGNRNVDIYTITLPIRGPLQDRLNQLELKVSLVTDGKTNCAEIIRTAVLPQYKFRLSIGQRDGNMERGISYDGKLQSTDTAWTSVGDSIYNRLPVNLSVDADRIAEQKNFDADVLIASKYIRAHKIK